MTGEPWYEDVIGARLAKAMRADIAKVGPHGWEHGWHYVGVPGGEGHADAIHGLATDLGAKGYPNGHALRAEAEMRRGNMGAAKDHLLRQAGDVRTFHRDLERDPHEGAPGETLPDGTDKANALMHLDHAQASIPEAARPSGMHITDIGHADEAHGFRREPLAEPERGSPLYEYNQRLRTVAPGNLDDRELRHAVSLAGKEGNTARASALGAEVRRRGARPVEAPKPSGGLNITDIGHADEAHGFGPPRAAAKPAVPTGLLTDAKRTARGMSDAELRAADAELGRRAAALGKPGQLSGTHRAVRAELARRRG